MLVDTHPVTPQVPLVTVKQFGLVTVIPDGQELTERVAGKPVE